jgi:hypothetical protein
LPKGADLADEEGCREKYLALPRVIIYRDKRRLGRGVASGVSISRLKQLDSFATQSHRKDGRQYRESTS